MHHVSSTEYGCRYSQPKHLAYPTHIRTPLCAILKRSPPSRNSTSHASVQWPAVCGLFLPSALPKRGVSLMGPHPSLDDFPLASTVPIPSLASILHTDGTSIEPRPACTSEDLLQYQSRLLPTPTPSAYGYLPRCNEAPSVLWRLRRRLRLLIYNFAF